jgi:flagellar biosynthetic protein FlhB
MADPSKTESATPRRREEARKRGQVARSVEINTAVGLLGAWALFHFWGAFMLEELAGISRFAWGNLGKFSLTFGEFQRYLFTFVLKVVLLIGPLFAGVFLVGVLSNVLQFGFLFSAEPLALKPQNLNPAQGFQRLFSRRTAVEFFKNLVKIVLVVVVTWLTVQSRLPAILLFLQSDLGQFFNQLGALSSQLFLRLGLCLLGLAALDYWYQRYEFEESIKMSKQEVKDEYKQLEGDPQIKARVRQIQRENSRRRMLADLPKADVVITNPTHLAVAVQYDGKAMDAPRVVAKGARLMAERIKELAREHEIPVMENKPLARALFESTPVGGQVPGNLFSAVAELLAFVYQMQGKLVEKAQENRERLARSGYVVPDPAAGARP